MADKISFFKRLGNFFGRTKPEKQQQAAKPSKVNLPVISKSEPSKRIKPRRICKGWSNNGMLGHRRG